NIKKCKFCQPKLVFLGYVVSPDGVTTDPAKIEKMVNYPIPTDIHQLRGFIGLLSFYRQFIPNFSRIAHPLNILCKKGHIYEWTSRQQRAFDELKHLATVAPVLAYPDLKKRFRLYTDASLLGLG